MLNSMNFNVTRHKRTSNQLNQILFGAFFFKAKGVLPGLSLALRKVALDLLNPQGCDLMCYPLVPQGLI